MTEPEEPVLRPRVRGAAAAYMAWVLSEKLTVARSGCWEFPSENGYPSLDLKNWDWVERAPSLHRIVYRLCVGPLDDNLHVLHRCDNPKCLRPDHLFLGTNLDNIKDKVNKNRQAKGQSVRKNHGHLLGVGVTTAKLNAEKVMEIRRADSQGESQTSIATRFGVSSSQVSAIVRGRSWAHLPILCTGGRLKRSCPKCGQEIDTKLGRYTRHVLACQPNEGKP